MAKRFIDISITGDRRLAKKFKKMQKVVQGRIMKAAAKKALEPVHRLAVAMAPLGETGRTKKWIKIGVAKGKRWQVGAEVRTGTAKQMGLLSSADYYYPAAHEFGTKHLKQRSFMETAMDERRKLALRILTGEIKRLMRQQ